MEFNLLVVWVISTLYGQMFFTFAETCDQQGKEDCCYGYIWNETTHRCEKCSPGVTGPGCTIRCEYPAYGEACSGFCRCDLKLCDSVFGCYVSSPGNEITYIHQSETMAEGTETKTTAVRLAGRGTTEEIATRRIGTSPVSLVSYLTVVLTCVFTALFLVYIATYFPKFKSFIKGSDTIGITFNENDSSMYAYV